MSRLDNRFEDIDKAALHAALLRLNTCPRCGRDLRPLWTGEPGRGCVTCDEVYPASEAEASAHTEKGNDRG